ncbi:MAG: hypothetical protein ACRDPD_13770, partial [Streptosporangiaceae bacterium]
GGVLRRGRPQERTRAAPVRPGPDNAAPAAPDRAAADEDAACWREAARLRREHRGWIVIWLAAENCYRAYRRLPGARRDTALSAATPAEMADLIGQAERAGTKRPARSGPGTR